MQPKNFRVSQQRNQRVTEAMKAAGAAVILKPSVGEHGTAALNYKCSRCGTPVALRIRSTSQAQA